MRVCVLGGDGYLGWPCSVYLSARGHQVLTLDSFIKREWEKKVGSEPLAVVKSLEHRIEAWRTLSGHDIAFRVVDIANEPEALCDALATFQPEAIVHFAEQCSAPYSMASRVHAVETQRNNVMGTLNLMFAVRETCPEAHLVKLGTMGEYGTPNIDIEEGWLEVDHKGRRDRVLYPKRPGSFYHLSKVHDSANLEFGCRIWGQRVTDLNQGVVYGHTIEELGDAPDLGTSFHYDATFGTAINRFVVQVVADVPLTVYGRGGQTRGYLNIRDTMRCIELALLFPAKRGEFRVFNQITENFSVNALAAKVARVGNAMGFRARIDHIPNPRVELEEHYYNPTYTALRDLGLEPHLLTDRAIEGMILHAVRHRHRINVDSILPKIGWA